MSLSSYASALSASVFALGLLGAPVAQAQPRSKPPSAALLPAARPAIEPTPVTMPPPSEPAPAATRPAGIISTITLGDIGFLTGLRFANLGGRREVFVPLPHTSGMAPSELVLVLDDVSAHEARRSLEVLVNDRTALAIVLDGRSSGRTVRVPLAGIMAKEGFLKLTFIYSGAATADRCIDVRYVGDSLAIRPESAVEIDIGPAGALDVAMTAALMPRQVAIALPPGRLTPAEIATALAVGRSLLASGRRISWHRGYERLAELAKLPETNRWSRGLVLIGSLDQAAGQLDAPVATIAGAVPEFGTLAAVRVRGMPALLVAADAGVRAGRLLASSSLAATRGLAAASIGDAGSPPLPTDRVTFDQLGVPPAQAEVFGRADLTAAIDMRRLPASTRPARLLLQVMVAPDGAGEKAVVSAYVNDRFLGGTVAASDAPTQLDLALPEGLIGASANVRAVVQRRSAQGDCRFEPQGYPAQILGSSAIVLAPADSQASDFSDLAAHWANGIEILVPAFAAEQPAAMLGLLAETLNAFSPATAPIAVHLIDPGAAPAPSAAFLALSAAPPQGAAPHVRFDRGRTAVTDRTGRTLLDLAGFTGGAVAQIATAGSHVGLWIRPLSTDGTVPAPAEFKLDRGDVAFLDRNGVALAMSTERNTLLRISYPDQVSWLTVADRFRPWLIGAFWLFVTVVVLFALQRMLRRRPNVARD